MSNGSPGTDQAVQTGEGEEVRQEPVPAVNTGIPNNLDPFTLLSPSTQVGRYTEQNRKAWSGSPNGRAFQAFSINRGTPSGAAVSAVESPYTSATQALIDALNNSDATQEQRKDAYTAYLKELGADAQWGKDQGVYQEEYIYLAFLDPRLHILVAELNNSAIELDEDFFLKAFEVIAEIFQGNHLGADKEIQFLELFLKGISRERLVAVKDACDRLSGERYEQDQIAYNYMNWYAMADFNLTRPSRHLFPLSFEQVLRLIFVAIAEPKLEEVIRQKAKKAFRDGYPLEAGQMIRTFFKFCDKNKVKTLLEGLKLDSRVANPLQVDPFTLVEIIHANSKVAQIFGLESARENDQVIGEAIFNVLLPCVAEPEQSSLTDGESVIRDAWRSYYQNTSHDIFKRILALKIYNFLVTRINLTNFSRFEVSHEQALRYALDINLLPVRNLFTNDFKILWEQTRALVKNEIEIWMAMISVVPVPALSFAGSRLGCSADRDPNISPDLSPVGGANRNGQQ